MSTYEITLPKHAQTFEIQGIPFYQDGLTKKKGTMEDGVQFACINACPPENVVINFASSRADLRPAKTNYRKSSSIVSPEELYKLAKKPRADFFLCEVIRQDRPFKPYVDIDGERCTLEETLSELKEVMTVSLQSLVVEE